MKTSVLQAEVEKISFPECCKSLSDLFARIIALFQDAIDAIGAFFVSMVIAILFPFLS
ncbi:MAG: hypothetical protein PHV34_22175 [Verrucomicrobiae bacterium]|nr:hypothetical protein [Verrucomicrobiae bacterium]